MPREFVSWGKGLAAEMLKINNHYFRLYVPASQRRLRWILAANAAVTAFLSAFGFAADLPAAPAPEAFTWTGLYIGGNVGAWFAPTSPSYEALGFRSPGFDLIPNGGSPHAGVTGGVQGGYNYQIGSFVPGFETDLNYLSNCRSGTFATPPAYAPFGIGSYTLSGGCSYYFGSLRGRLGYAVGDALIYATAGVAYGGNRRPGSVALNPPAFGNYFVAGETHSARAKYVFGAGIEYALSDHWFARAEYQYVNLGRIDQFFANGLGQAYFSSQFNQNHVFRVGLDYKFDDGAPASEAPPAASSEAKAPKADAEQYSAHGMVTWVPQGYPSFPAAYTGPHSLPPHAHVEAVLMADAFLGLGLWNGAALYFNPEIDQGFAVGNTFGVAGFPNAYGFKIGKTEPYERNQRFFVRQFIGLGGETEKIDAGPYQLAGAVDSNHLTFTIGKYSIVDIFDDNKYAHDPTSTFLNWTIIDMAGFDYAADSWGYTYGATAEWKQDWWTARAGVFQLSRLPSSADIEPVLFRQFQPVVEFEERHTIQDQPGKLKFLFYASDGFMGSYNQAVAEAEALGITPDISSVRARRIKVGGGLNLEQQITPSIGLFARLCMLNDQYESFDFTEVERSASGGVVISGDLWGRDKDQIGIGGVLNAISHAHANYLAAGGLGFLLGDGALSYDGERILETYYKYTIADGIHISLDYQFVDNPGYNLARGPVSLFALRLHAEF
jgi:high affinity Mn2+ porin